MLAILVRQFGDPEVMKLEQVDEPTPGPGEVLVRARAIGVNPVETYVRTGNYASVTGMTPFNATPADLRRIHHGLAAGFRSGALSPVIDRRFPLAGAAAAHRAVMEAGHAGKIVLVP